MSPEEANTAILELKLKALERKLERLKSDMVVLAIFVVVVSSFRYRYPGMPEHAEGWLFMAAGAAIAVFGFIEFIRDRRAAKRDAERIQNIYLSIHPTSP